MIVERLERNSLSPNMGHDPDAKTVFKLGVDHADRTSKKGKRPPYVVARIRECRRRSCGRDLGRIRLPLNLVVWYKQRTSSSIRLPRATKTCSAAW